MALLLYSVIRRHMRPTGRYTEHVVGAEAPIPFEMHPDEVLLGWYKNPEPWGNCMIVFTDRSIYSSDKGQVVRIPLENILDYEAPASKTEVTGVRVRTPDGFRFLRAAGSFGPEGGQRDAFSLIQVIRAIARQNAR